MAQRDRNALRPGGVSYDRRRFLRNAGLGVAGLAGGVLLEACGSSASSTTTTTAAASGSSTTTTAMSSMDALIAAAKAEGRLNLIADPNNWANYGTQSTPGTVIGDFYAKYGIQCPVASPNDTSAQELEAILTDKGTSNAPDAVDVSPAIALQGVQKGVFAPYKVSTWDEVPASMKDPNGYWTGDYWGVISFGTNTKVVKNPPKSWSDLTKPEYKGQVAIDGSPASAGDALAAVWSAALANGGSLDNIMPGLEFFAHLKAIGNFNPVDCYPANIVSGRDADRDRLGLPQHRLQQAVPEHQLCGQPADRRQVRELLLPGGQLHSCAPKGCRAVDGVPLLRRGPAGLPRRIRPPSSVPSVGICGEDSGVARREASTGKLL